MIIFLNDIETVVDDNITVALLLQQRSIALDGTAVAVNRDIVPKSSFDSFVLRDGMRVDVFSLVAGG